MIIAGPVAGSRRIGRRALFRAAALPLLAATLGGCPDPETEPPNLESSWQVVLDEGDLAGTVLSVWGSSPTDVYVVGGPLGNTGYEALALHFDGSTFRDLKPGGPESFWWVGGSGPSDVWMVGTEGRIAHWNGATFTEHASGTTATLWGVWAASPTDAWIVGGSPDKGTMEPNDIVLHWDGAAWSPEVLPGEPRGLALFKVWGTSSDDLYVVGEAGILWHRTGVTWALEPDPPIAAGSLFTVQGCSAADVYAVGNLDVLHKEGGTWSKLVEITGGGNGVACGRAGEVAIVGLGSLKQRLVDGAWVDESTARPNQDLHAVWADGAGSFWVVGGDLFSNPAPMKRRKGVVGRYGPGSVSGAVAP